MDCQNINCQIFFWSFSILLTLSLVIARRERDERYFFGTGGLTSFQIMMTILATQLGVAAVIGAADTAFTSGWIAWLYSIGLSCGLITLSWLFGKKLRSTSSDTVPQMFFEQYKSKKLQAFTSALYAISFFGILIGVVAALQKFLLSLGLNQYWFLAVWGAILFYAVMGGFVSAVKTDVLQLSFVLTALFVLLVYVANSDISHVSSAFHVAESVPTPSRTSLFLAPLLFASFGQDMMRRYRAAKTDRQAALSTIMAAILLAICGALPVYIGTVANRVGLKSNGSVFLDLVKDATGPNVAAIIACALALVLLTATSSLVNSIAAQFVLDFGFWNKLLLRKGDKWVAKIIALLVGTGALIFSYTPLEVLSTITSAYEITVCVLACSIVCMLMSKPLKFEGVICSIASGACFYAFGAFKNPLIALELGLTGSALGAALGQRLKRKAGKNLAN